MSWRKALCIILFMPINLMAAEVNYSAGITMMRASNINHVYEPIDNELSETLRGTIFVDENSIDLVANLNATAEVTQYSNNQVGDETTGQLNASMIWYIKPEQFEWYLSNVFTQIAIDSLSSDTPSNRQNVNSFVTGPNYYIHLNRRANIELEGRAENYSYGNANTDNNRVFLASRLLYALNSSVMASLNYENEQVYFNDDIANNNYTRNDVFLGLEYQRNRNRVEINGGYSQVNNDISLDREESRFLFALENQRNSTITARAEYSRELSDSSQDIQDLIDEPDPADLAIIGVADLYTNTVTRVVIRKNLVGGDASLALYKSEADYLTINSQDEIGKGIILNAMLNMQGRSNFLISGNFLETTYVNALPIRVDKDGVYSMTYIYNLGHDINISVSGEYYERKSTLAAEDFDDRRVIFSVEYSTR